jgi:hypothetical protein
MIGTLMVHTTATNSHGRRDAQSACSERTSAILASSAVGDVASTRDDQPLHHASLTRNDQQSCCIPTTRRAHACGLERLRSPDDSKTMAGQPGWPPPSAQRRS